MIIPSEAFINELESGNRKYIVSASIITSNQTYTIGNSAIWENSMFIEDMVNQDSVITVGEAIINKLTIGLNNINEQYSNIKFEGALVLPKVGLLLSNGQIELLDKGIFIVDDQKYNGSIITLTCLDLMERFDRLFDSELTYPATLSALVAEACEKCGITINGTKYPLPPVAFNNSAIQIPEKPTRENLTWREVIAWVAQIAGSYARVDRSGMLQFGWFDRGLLDTLNGSGDKTGLAVDYIDDCFSTDIAVDKTTITGIEIIYQVKEDDETEVRKITNGDTGIFKLTITDNDLISSDTIATAALNAIVTNTVGMSFYRASITHVSNPCIEAGDVGYARNFRGKYYPIIISRTKFGISTSQVTASNAETALVNTSYRNMPSINYNTNVPIPEIPTDLIVITAPDGDDYAIYVEINPQTGLPELKTEKVPKYIYFYTEPTTQYLPGAPVDVSGAVVHAVFNDATEIDVTSQCTFDPADGTLIDTDIETFTITATWIYTPGSSS